MNKNIPRDILFSNEGHRRKKLTDAEPTDEMNKHTEERVQESQDSTKEAITEGELNLSELVDISTSSSNKLRDTTYASLSEGEVAYLISNLKLLNSSEKQTVLEALVFMNDAFNDEMLHAVMAELNDEEQGAMVYFLGTCVDTMNYIDSFQTYFQSVLYLEPETVGLSPNEYPRGKLIDRFTKEFPERAILVAPFTDLTRLCVTEAGDIQREAPKPARYSRFKPKTEPVKTKPYLQEYVPYYKDIADLIERVIRHPYTADSPQYAKALVQYYHENAQGALIIPYLPELIDRQLVSIEEARLILREGEQVFSFFSRSAFKHPEEQRRIKMLEERTREIYPEKLKDQSYIDRYEMPKNFQQIEAQYSKLAMQRTAEYLLSDTESLKPLFSSDAMWDQFLATMMSCDLPVFSVLPEGSFTSDDVQRILRVAEDQGDGLSYTHRVQECRALSEAGMERQAYTLLLEVMDKDYNCAPEVMREFEEIKDYLSPARFKSLCESIDRSSPELWLCNMRAMELYSEDSLRIRVDKLATAEKLPADYMKMYNYIRMEEEQGRETSISRAELQATARELVERNPSLMFEDPFFAQAFPNVSRSELAVRHLQTQPDEEFIRNCLYHTNRVDNDEFTAAVREPIRRAILTHEDAIAGGLLNHAYRYLKDVFNRSERLSFLFRHLDTLDARESHFSYDTLMAKDLIARPDKFQQFLQYFCQEELNTSVLEQLADNLESFRGTLYGSKYSDPKPIKGMSRENLDAALTMFRSYIALVSLQKPTILLNEDIQDVMGLSDPEEDTGPGMEQLAAPIAALIRGESDKDPLALMQGAEERTGCTRMEMATAFCKTVLTYQAEAIVTRYPLHLLKMRNVIADDTYEALLSKHFEGLALSPDKNGAYPLEKALENDEPRLVAFHRFEPHAQAEKLANEKDIDFYRALQSVMARSNHYEFFNQELEKLVEQEVFDHGERKSVSTYDQNREIASMARQLVALDHIDGSWQFADYLYELPAEKRAQLINQLHYVTLFTPDVISELRACITDGPTRDALLESAISNHMQHLFDLDPEVHGVVKLDEIPDAEMLRALVSYYSTTCVGNDLMEVPFREYSARIFKGEFYTWRAWGTEDEPQTDAERAKALERLKEEQLVPEKINVQQYIEWQSELQGEVEADVSESESQLFVECKRILRHATPLHIPAQELEGDIQQAVDSFRALIIPLDRYTQRRNEYREKLKAGKGSEEEIAAWKEEFNKAKDGQRAFLEQNRDLMATRTARVLLQHVIHGPGPLRDGKMLIQHKWVSIDEVFQKLQDTYGKRYPDFAVDLRAIENNYRKIERIHTGKAEISKSVLTLTDRVDMKTYFFMGERPVQSCQHYDSANGYNQGLLSTSTDPSMKVLQIYDQKGRIISRAVLRLLQTEDGEPALLLERVYSMNNHPDVYKSIYRFAESKAERLGIRLYGQPTELSFADFKYDDITNLVSRNSRGGYVYTDAGGGLQKKGEFVARHAIGIGSRRPEFEAS